MKRICFIGAFILIASFTVTGQKGHKNPHKITTFIVIRHAEKSKEESKDPELSPEGAERSKKLARMLHDAGVTAIYSTNYKRTRNTVMPLSTEKGIDIQLYESFTSVTIDEVIGKYPGGTIVISGHSNTVPGIVNLLIGNNKFQNLDDSNYSAMFIVSVAERGKVASVTQLQY